MHLEDRRGPVLPAVNRSCGCWSVSLRPVFPAVCPCAFAGGLPHKPSASLRPSTASRRAPPAHKPRAATACRGNRTPHCVRSSAPGATAGYFAPGNCIFLLPGANTGPFALGKCKKKDREQLPYSGNEKRYLCSVTKTIDVMKLKLLFISLPIALSLGAGVWATIRLREPVSA